MTPLAGYTALPRFHGNRNDKGRMFPEKIPEKVITIHETKSKNWKEDLQIIVVRRKIWSKFIFNIPGFLPIFSQRWPPCHIAKSTDFQLDLFTYWCNFQDKEMTTELALQGDKVADELIRGLFYLQVIFLKCV